MKTYRVRNPRELGRVIAEIRHRRGLRQVDLAHAALLHRSYLARLENGHATEQLQRLFALVRELGYEVTLIEQRADG